MIKFAFFGTDEFAVTVLTQLKKLELKPELIVTMPDKPKGRKLLLTPSPVKVWAEKNKIDSRSDPEQLKAGSYQLFIVASYGQIIKKEILDLPKFGTLNVHPSLLPKYRGPSPIQTAILDGDEETGVSIMLLDEEMDHGSILAGVRCQVLGDSFPELRDKLAKLGGEMLAEVMPKWVEGKIEAKPQDHGLATFTKKIKKSDGEIKLTDNSTQNYRKFLAYQPWPGIFFFDKNNKRVKITDVVLENEIFAIKKVVPEGRPEMRWENYERGV